MHVRQALVTGSAGFIGRHMVAELEKRGWKVHGVDTADPVVPSDALYWFRTWLKQYDLVVHAAARSPHRLAIDTQPASHIYNQLLDASLFNWAVETRQRRVLYFSSCAVLDDDPDDYGWIKLTGEGMAMQARAAGIPVTVVRPYSGYGEDQSEDFPFGAFVARARRFEDPFPVWNADAVRDWIHVDDVIAGALAAVESDTDEAVSLCTGIGTSMRELISMMTTQMGYHPDIQHLLDKPTGTAVRVGKPSFFTPRISLEEGVKRALSGGGNSGLRDSYRPRHAASERR